uniref:Histone-lysine N-methyltransferase n=1 Tax=Spongospora subterranea TaxID=70186 RepID=A0A0H5RC62_9EUKA|eukprot:CRZ11197.1 hypothetical protein [Spongospora subterranea]
MINGQGRDSNGALGDWERVPSEIGSPPRRSSGLNRKRPIDDENCARTRFPRRLATVVVAHNYEQGCANIQLDHPATADVHPDVALERHYTEPEFKFSSHDDLNSGVYGRNHPHIHDDSTPPQRNGAVNTSDVISRKSVNIKNVSTDDAHRGSTCLMPCSCRRCRFSSPRSPCLCFLCLEAKNRNEYVVDVSAETVIGQAPVIITKPSTTMASSINSVLDLYDRKTSNSNGNLSDKRESSSSHIRHRSGDYKDYKPFNALSPGANRQSLSAEERKVMLASVRFPMSQLSSVTASAVIPRVSAELMPRKPLVRPVFKPPASLTNIVPAKVVRLRSSEKPPGSPQFQPDDEIVLQPEDEVVSEESDDSDVDDGTVADVEKSNFRYVEYAKGNIGVKLLSLVARQTPLTSGLYHSMSFPRSRSKQVLPLPLGHGVDLLHQTTGFQLPFLMVQMHLAEKEIDMARKHPSSSFAPAPFFLLNQSVKLPSTILPEYMGGDEVLDCCCPVSLSPGCGSECINRLTHVECEPDECRLRELCTNQRFQRRQWANLSVEYMQEKGWGLRLQQDVFQGDFIIEYVGELIDTDTCKRRCHDDYNGEQHFYFLTLYSNIVIDATRKGNISRFTNHSCDPTCETQKWSVKGSPRVGIFARRDLPKGSEVTFDYNFERIGLAKTKCLCGSDNCRGYLGAARKSKKKGRRSEQLVAEDMTDASSVGSEPSAEDVDDQDIRVQELINNAKLPESFLSMVEQIGPRSTQPSLLLRNVIRVHACFPARLDYCPN